MSEFENTDNEFLEGLEDELIIDLGDIGEDDIQEVEQIELTYRCHPATYTSVSSGAVVNLLFTTEAEVAKVFSEEVDEFSDSEYFVIHEGVEVLNNSLLQKLEVSEEIRLSKEDILNYSKVDFNTLYIKAMLGIAG